MTKIFHTHTTQGRNNLFYALLLFLRYYVRESAGYLDTLYLGGSLGLLEIARCGVE